ncbi:MAG: SpoIIIAH-like family protein [bacterium]|jgi:stage III sporulation protein AH|nr:SpoIIIAH-like family protein [Bacillota bacterium]
MRWQERNITTWLLICVAVLLASAFYLRNQQLAKSYKLAEPPPKENSEPGPSAELGSEKQQTEPRRQDFYVEQRLDRDRVRSQEIDTLREIIHNPNTDEENRKEAQARLILLSEELAKEVEIEALIKAKGFADALVYLHSDSVHVLVKAPDLTADEAARIGDVVARSSGLPLENIIIDTRL